MSGNARDILSITTPLPDTRFRIIGLAARERLSRPFSYLVDLTSGTQALQPNSLIDQKVTITLGDPKDQGRYFSGVVQAVRQLPSANAKIWDYRLTVVPKLWFLGQTQSSRFYQNMTAPDIIEAILGKFSVEYGNVLQGTYAKRDYTVQFNESYLHFLQRLMEDEGIFYFFQHGEGTHKMVLGDRKAAFVKIAKPALEVRDVTPGSHDFGSYCLSKWEREDQSAIGEFIEDDYDPATNTLAAPPTIRGTAPTVLKASGAADRKHYAWPAIRGAPGGANDKATSRMQAAEAAAQIYAGAGAPLDFFAGGSFGIAHDPTASGGAGNFVLLSVDYDVTNSGDGRYGAGGTAMTCTAFPVETQWREAPAHAPPVMAGLYTAKVIGPAGEDIYVDDSGRIKVWFPWDYESDIDEGATLWVRVMQPWGGAGWGSQFIPRIGMEVVVGFLEGDVNRPMVVGSLYNSQNPPLFKAADKNKSGIRTRSTLKGGDANYNELSFDDTKGSEVFFLHAEKDYKLEVENDQTLTVDNNRNVTVTKDETVKVDGKQGITVKEDRTLTVSEGKMATTVSQGDHSLTVSTGNHSTTVSTGNHSTTVSQGNHSTTVSMGNRTAEVSMGNESLKVDLGTITYEAMQSITLKVGASSIVIDNTGITLKGIMIQASGDAMATVKGAMVEVNGSGMLTLAGGITMIN